MRILTLLTSVFICGHGAFATTMIEAEKIASMYLRADVKMDQQSSKSYFFVTGLEGNDDFPCIRGVLVNKESGKIVEPNSDAEINIYFPYSDTRIEGLSVVNCAD